jgi:hypothetical protein
MAPESPSRLVVLDFYRQLSHGFGLKVDRFESDDFNAFLRVSWAATRSRGEGYLPVADGVVHVSTPAPYRHYQYEAMTRPSNDLSRISWTENTEGGFLMLVAIQPPETALQEVLEGPPPEEAKDFNGRMAIFWAILPGQYSRIRLTWRIANLSEMSLLGACARVNDLALRTLELAPDFAEPPLAERLRNLDNAPQPVNALPAAAADPQTLRDYLIYAQNVTVSNNIVQVTDAEGNVIVQQRQDGSQHFNFFEYDHAALAAELSAITAELRQRFPEDERVSDLERASEAAGTGDVGQLRSRLRKCGNWVLATMTEIVPELAASAIKASLGLP